MEAAKELLMGVVCGIRFARRTEDGWSGGSQSRSIERVVDLGLELLDPLGV